MHRFFQKLLLGHHTVTHFKRHNLIQKQRSFYLPVILLLTMAFITLSVVLVNISSLQRRTARIGQEKITALGVAEAGINYYLWHLAHDGTDFSDGNPAPQNTPYGPYVHDYKNSNGDIIGSYSLLITPSSDGSSLVTITSTGTLINSSKTRTVKAILGIPSFSQYAALVGAGELWFRDDETTDGPVHSNVGVRFDGTNNGIVSASNLTYVPSVNFGGNGNSSHDGVWGSGGPKSQWIFPIPPVDFQQVTSDLQTLKTKATAGGHYLPKSSNLGYFIQFKNDGTYNLATVTNYTFNTFTYTALINQLIPLNGIIYSDDDIWVEGTVKGRYTVVAATLPSVVSTDRDITITNNIIYTTRNGSDTLGLIGQHDVKAGPMTPDNFEIDAAILAQTGKAYRPCRWDRPDEKNCFKGNGHNSDTYNTRSNITIYGSISSFGSSTWNWSAGNDGTLKSGYEHSSHIYDSRLLYGPPPGFPTTGKYTLLSWRELIAP